jgi:hypothetical protein
MGICKLVEVLISRCSVCVEGSRCVELVRHGTEVTTAKLERCLGTRCCVVDLQTVRFIPKD